MINKYLKEYSESLIKSDELGYAWSWFSDPFDFTTHMHNYYYYFEEEFNLDTRPRGTADRIQAGIYAKHNLFTSYNFVNMMVKFYAYTKREDRFLHHDDFVYYAIDHINKQLREQENLRDLVCEYYFVPECLLKLRKKEVGNFLGPPPITETY